MSSRSVKKFQVVDNAYLERQIKRKKKVKEKSNAESISFDNPFASLTKEDLMIGIKNVKEN